MINTSNHKILYPVLFIGVIFLFFGKTNQFDFRIFEALWNLGHVLITFIAALLISTNWNYFKAKSFWQQLFLIVVIIFIIGGVVELLQSKMGRDASWDDLFLDVLGAVTAIAFFSVKVKSKSTYFKWSRNFIILLLYLYALMPLISDITDEIIQFSQFPVLSNFETPFEAQRWDAEIQARISNNARSGKYSLKIKVAEYKYQGVGFQHFIRDWSTYKTFNISIFNTLDKPTKFSIKIYDDIHHRNPMGYNDRFNRTVMLDSGWNDIQITTKDIKEGPRKRVMDLTYIRKVTVFPLKEQKPFYIYIDDVYLK